MLRPASPGDPAGWMKPVPASGTKLIAARYVSVEAAESARDALRELADQTDLTLQDVAIVVRRDDGRIELRQTGDIAVGEGLVAGGSIGLLLGLAVAGPVGGALVGMLGGGGYGALDRGVDDDKMRSFGHDLPAGSAAVFALVRTTDAPRARDALLRYDGELVADDADAEGSG